MGGTSVEVNWLVRMWTLIQCCVPWRPVSTSSLSALRTGICDLVSELAWKAGSSADQQFDRLACRECEDAIVRPGEAVETRRPIGQDDGLVHVGAYECAVVGICVAVGAKFDASRVSSAMTLLRKVLAAEGSHNTFSHDHFEGFTS